jgi:hypothetical protein
MRSSSFLMKEKFIYLDEIGEYKDNPTGGSD